MNKGTKELEVFEELMDQMPCASGLFEPLSGEMIFLNAAYYSLVGYTAKEYKVIHKNGYKEHIFEADISVPGISAEEFKRTGKALDYEYRIIHKDQSILWVKMNATLMEIGGNRYAFVSFTDITKEKEAYLQVTMIAENTNSGVALFKMAHGREDVVYANSKFFEMLGVSKEEYLRDIHAYDQIYVKKEDHERIQNTILQAYNTGQAEEVEHEFVRPDGRRLWINRRYRVIKQIDPDTFMLVTVVTDRTEKKKIEDAEHEQNLMLTNLLNELPGGVAIFKITNRLECQYFSNGFAAMSGRSREEVSRMLKDDDLLMQGIPKEYYQDFLQHLQADNPIGKTLSFTYHFIMNSGELGWLHVAVIKIREEDGYPIYYCIYTNPTDETTLYRNIVEDSAIGVYIADRKTRTNLYANEAFCSLCGFEVNKISGRPLEKILQKYNKAALLSREDVASLSFNKYSEFHVTRRGLYLAIKAKAVMWNGVDSYILYIADETTEHANQLQLEQTLVKEQTLMEAIPGGAAIYRIKKDGRSVMEYVSEGVCRLLGYSREEMLGFSDIWQFVYQEDLFMAEKAVQAAVENRKSICVIYRIITKKREVILNRLDAKVIFTEDLAQDDAAVLYAVHTKISDESKLAMQEQKYYRKILNMTGTAYFEWSRDNGFYASEDYGKYMMSAGGYDAIMGSSYGVQCVHPDDIALLHHYILKTEENQRVKSITVRMKMKDGRYQWTEVVSYAQCDQDGNFIKLIGVLRDVNKEWIERNKKLQVALDSAEKANRAKTAFLSRVSHDMRTPLNGILGLTEFLKDSVTDEQALKDISQLEISGQYLLNLINDTLDVSRIENGKLELHPTVCDGAETFENIQKLSRPGIEAKQQQFIVTANLDKDMMLYTDVGRVEQVVMNIIGNAVKFTPKGGTIEFSLKQMGETSTSTTIRIIIKDSGIGMSKEFLPNIFDAFSQANDTQTNARQGTGLGMAITKQLVDLMGGTIKVESELGKGSTFTLVIPLKKATTHQIETWKASLKKEVDNSILKDKRVLLCEDHPLNAQIATRLLKNKGMIVEWAQNGKMGVDMFKDSAFEYFDLVLMDVRMPVMDGLDATRAIRKLSRKDALTLPIIAMTGNSFDEDVARTLDAGMNAHLSKPIDSVKLFETLREQLETTQCYHRTKVLIVDDIELNRVVVQAAITPDYETAEASDGESAIQILQNDKGIDAVITDLMMLGMDGFELIKWIRSKPQYDHIALIVNTQYGELSKEDELMLNGVNGVIYKPNLPEDIIKKLRMALKEIKNRNVS